jgi:ABC-type antimicrobial peptide transport system permease subunit
VVSEGTLIASIGIVAGAAGGYAVGRVAAQYGETTLLPGAITVLAAAAVLMCAADMASLMPAARASRVDVVQALRSE